jgi:hypothetical protein
MSEIYAPMKFYFDISKAFLVMLWTKINFEKKTKGNTHNY